MLASSSQDHRRRRATGGGKRTKAGGAASSAVAAEAKDIVRRAAGDVAGKTVAAQVRQAARHLGYDPDDWRVREAWYGRAGSWSAAALDELRRRFAEWRKHALLTARGDSREAIRARLDAARAALDEVERLLAGLKDPAALDP